MGSFYKTSHPFFKCLQYKSEYWENSEFTDKWKEEMITHDGQVAVTRQNQDSADAEHVNGITDLVQAGSIMAIAAADDACYDYYLLNVSSQGSIALPSDTIDDYGGSICPGGKRFSSRQYHRYDIS